MKPNLINLKLIIFLFLFSFDLNASNATDKAQYIETKTYDRTFSVAKDALLMVSNKYGKVHVNTWDKNQIDIVVTVKYGGRNEEIAKEKINCIKINMNADENHVRAQTVFDCNLSSRTMSSTNGKIDRLIGPEIDYEIKIPKQGKLQIANKYGNIVLGVIQGQTEINLKYGAFVAQALNNSQNLLRLKYSYASTIESANKLTIENTGYSDLSVDSAKNIRFDTDYTNISIGRVNQIRASSMGYGKLKIGIANCTELSLMYSRLVINQLKKCLTLGINYGSYKINNVIKGFDSIKINSKYTGGSVKVDQDASFKFYTKARYAGINLPDNVVIEKKIKTISNTNKTFEGNYNTVGNAAYGNININSAYGGINIKLRN